MQILGKKNESNLPSLLYTIRKVQHGVNCFGAKRKIGAGCSASLYRLCDCEEWVGSISGGDGINFRSLPHLLVVFSCAHFNN